ncbi:MAG TPA: Hsp20/alpha crystallin family protein [Chloroflexota bacterium]|nr:Hsp20/alpha crystallin family protein [Chloroflexota bacterium]
MANTLTRYSRPDMVPTRSLIDQLLEGSFFAPSAMDHWFNPTTGVPANLIETADHYIVQVALPGLDADKLEINAVQRDLRIKGVYEQENVENANYIWHGLPSGEFSQTFTLPAEVMGENAEATYTNGILSISIPKAQNARVKTIPVKKTV